MAYTDNVITIEQHIINGELAHPGATGHLSGILRQIAFAVKIIWREVNKAGLVNILGSVGRKNIHGDQVKKLDMLAHKTIFEVMEHSGYICVMASEEDEHVMPIPEEFPIGKYVLICDPLDGSSNIDVNVNIGTIFSVYRRITPSGSGTLEDCLQPGYKQVAAGYVVFGSSTMLVYTTGDGVHGFTFDPSIGEFLLSHENIRIPKRGTTYSVNEGNYNYWPEEMKRYIHYLKEINPAEQRPYSARYVGSMVADIHRTLLLGGIFMYPADTIHPEGKLRLAYETNPMAFIVEQAGGRASNGTERILDIIPHALHQKSPIFIGSEEDVAQCEAFLQNKQKL